MSRVVKTINIRPAYGRAVLGIVVELGWIGGRNRSVGEII